MKNQNLNSGRVSVGSSDLVHLLWEGAPPIGSKDAIWCGVKNGRNCTVGRDGDPFRLCTIIGYQIEMGEACGVTPRNAETITLLVKVRMNARHPLIEREHLSHVDCLQSYQVNARSMAATPEQP